ncbi:MAG: hypothetical protein OXG88_08075 [Gammaproteobacteria bacterium]|nr:hypothetical protein [Gammaproteobacteria bacterium]
MQKLIVVLLFLLVCVTSFGTPNTLEEMLADEDLTDQELYSWLKQKGMRDTTVRNGTIHNLILSGLKHEDPEIQHCVLSAIKGHVGINLHLRMNNAPVTDDRRLQDVPQIGELLMQLWEEEFNRAGGVVPPDDDYIMTLEEMERGFPCTGSRPAWTGLPRTLAFLHPGNPKVYELIWRVLAGKKTLPHKKEDNPFPLLVALYAGEFNHPKDQEFRIQVLTSPEADMPAMTYAAASLAKFQSPAGLAALVEVLENPKTQFGFAPISVIEAIMAYGDEAITQHRAVLAASLPKVFKQRRHNTSALWIERVLSQLPDEVDEVDKVEQPSR